MKQYNPTIGWDTLEKELTETARDVQLRINRSEDSTIANLGQTFQTLMIKCGLDDQDGQSETVHDSQSWPWIIFIVIWLVQLICDLFRQKGSPVVEKNDNNSQRRLPREYDIEEPLINLTKQMQGCDNEKPLQETKEIISQMNKMLEMVRIIKSSVLNSTNPIIRYESNVSDDDAYLDEEPIQSPSVALSLLSDEIEVPISPMVNDINSTEHKRMNDEADRGALTPQDSLPNSGTLALFDSRYTSDSNFSDNNNYTACLGKANDLIDSTIKLLTDIRPKLSATLWDKVSNEIDKIKKILCECNGKDTLKSSLSRQKKHTLFVFHPDKYQHESDQMQEYAKFIFQTFNTFFDQIKRLGVTNDIVDAFWDDLETRCQELFQSQDELRTFFASAIHEARKMERQADGLLNDFKKIKESTREMRKETQENIKKYDQMLDQVHQMRKENKEELRKIQADRAQIRENIAKTEEDIEETNKEIEKTNKDIVKTKKSRKQTEAKRKRLTAKLTEVKSRNEKKKIQGNYKSRSAPVLTRENIFFSKFSKRISNLKQEIDIRCNEHINKASTPDTIYIHLLVTIKSTLSAVEGNQVDNSVVDILLGEITSVLNKYQTNENNKRFFQALKKLSECVLDLEPLHPYKAEFENALAIIQENLYQQELSQYSAVNINSRVRLFSQSTPNLDGSKENNVSMSKQHSI
jgi:hypothetical protein